MHALDIGAGMRKPGAVHSPELKHSLGQRVRRNEGRGRRKMEREEMRRG